MALAWASSTAPPVIAPGGTNPRLEEKAHLGEVERRRRPLKQHESAVLGAIAGAAVGSATGDAGDGAIVGGTLGALEGGLAETDYDPGISPRKIGDRCMKNRGYKVLSDL